jgi:flagellar motility protein MotE (MotC chaperone)
MKRHAARLVIVAIGLAGIVLAGAGCQSAAGGSDQPDIGTPDAKKARLIAAENIDLKNALKSRDAEIERLKQQHLKELDQHQKSLADCKQRNDTLEKELKQGLEQRVNDITSRMVDENARLHEELANLKAEIQRLKEQMQVKP